MTQNLTISQSFNKVLTYFDSTELYKDTIFEFQLKTLVCFVNRILTSCNKKNFN